MSVSDVEENSLWRTRKQELKVHGAFDGPACENNENLTSIASCPTITQFVYLFSVFISSGNHYYIALE